MHAYLQFIILFAAFSSTAVDGFAQVKNSSNGLILFENLDELIRKNNENVEAARINVKAKQERTGRLARSFLPEVDAHLGTETLSYGEGPAETQGYWKVEANLNLYRGGRDKLEEGIKESNVDVAQAESSLRFLNELKEAQKTYWQLLSASKLMDSLKEAIEQNRTSLRSAQRRRGAGISTAADTLQFELHETQLNQELKKLELQRDLLRNRLSVALGIDEAEGIKIQEEFPALEEDKSPAPALQSEKQIDMKLLEAHQASKHLAQEKASRWWTPTLNLYTSYGLPTLSDEYERAIDGEREFAAGLVLGLPLGGGLEEKSEAAALSLEAKALESRKRQRAREIKAVDHELRHDLNLLGELIQESEGNLKKAQRFMSLTQDEYNRGVKNGPDLLSSIQTFYEFREQKIDLYSDYFEAKAELDALLATQQ